MKRPTILNILVFLSGILLAIFVHPVCVMLFIINFVYCILELVSHGFEEDNVFIGLDNNRYKRIHTDFGRFYLYVTKDDKIVLYRDLFFHLKFIDSYKFYDGKIDIEDIKIRVKNKTDEIMAEKIKRENTLNLVKNWSGFLTKQDERDKKISDIVK
jgi:hypothetical protein